MTTKKPSKQEAAKQAQGYTTEQRNCNTCAHRLADLKLPPWKARENARTPERPYWSDRSRVEVNKRCGIGGFAVKATATCAQWTEKQA